MRVHKNRVKLNTEHLILHFLRTGRRKNEEAGAGFLVLKTAGKKLRGWDSLDCGRSDLRATFVLRCYREAASTAETRHVEGKPH